MIYRTVSPEPLRTLKAIEPVSVTGIRSPPAWSLLGMIYRTVSPVLLSTQKAIEPVYSQCRQLEFEVFLRGHYWE